MKKKQKTNACCDYLVSHNYPLHDSIKLIEEELDMFLGREYNNIILGGTSNNHEIMLNII